MPQCLVTGRTRIAAVLFALMAELSQGGRVVGQHSDVLVQVLDGKLTTGVADFDSGINTLGARVYTSAFPLSFAVNNPGFNAVGSGGVAMPPGADPLPVSSDLFWDFLSMTSGAVRSNLLYWNAVGTAVAFGPTPAATYGLSLYGLSGGVLTGVRADGTDQDVTGNSIGRTSSTGGLHQHRFFFLDDDLDPNDASTPATGIYLIAMQLRMAGVETSAPFYLLFATPGVSLETLGATARPWVEANVDALIPPPLAGDYTGDGAVDGADLVAWQRQLGSPAALPGITADGDASGGVDAGDLVVWRSGWNAPPAADATLPAIGEAPEPSAIALALAGVGSLLAVARRRR